MFKSSSASGLKWLWLSFIVIILDFVTKAWAVETFALHERFTVLPFFNFTLVYNAGAAFSIFSQGDGWQRWFLSTVAIIVSLLIIYWLKKDGKMPLAHNIGLSLILGGAVGNLIDRVRFGYVIDFIDFHWNFNHFPAFNLADGAITLGAVLLLCTLWQKK